MIKARWGRAIAVSVALGVLSVTLFGSENKPRPQTTHAGLDIQLRRSPDGTDIVFCSRSYGNLDSWKIQTEAPQVLDEGKYLSSYEVMRVRLGELYQQRNYAEAADLLNEALLRFPGHIKANTYNLALMCGHLQQFDRGVNALLYGMEHGIWYGKFDFVNALWEPYKTHPGFLSFLEKNQKFLEQAQKTAKPQVMVKTPANYSTGTKYPLFVALHGGGENIEEFSQRWRSGRLEKEFIVAFFQSSQVISMDGYNWTEDMDVSRHEILEAYQKIKQQYPVDTERVLIGGFSSGGVASLEVSFDGILPVRGFVVLCPARPEGFTPERIQAAARRGLQGTLLTTEMDGRLEDQKAMAHIFDQEGFPCEFIVTPNIGHWYPEDLDTQIDSAIGRILDK